MLNFKVLGLRKKNRARSVPRASAPAFALPKISWARIVPPILSVVAISALLVGMGVSLDRQLKTVMVNGPFQRVPALEVERVVRENLNGGFLTANLSTIQHAVEKLPWADHARVQRHWPDGLYVQVTEQVAAARWGDSSLVNTRGEVFAVDARHIPEELPRLDGPAGSESQVTELFFQMSPRLLEQGLRPVALTQDARGAWQLELANGVVVRFGRRQLSERVDRFLRAGTAVLATKGAEISVLDMRYSNGFAVSWRAHSQPEASATPLQHLVKDQDNDV